MQTHGFQVSLLRGEREKRGRGGKEVCLEALAWAGRVTMFSCMIGLLRSRGQIDCVLMHAVNGAHK